MRLWNVCHTQLAVGLMQVRKVSGCQHVSYGVLETRRNSSEKVYSASASRVLCFNLYLLHATELRAFADVNRIEV